MQSKDTKKRHHRTPLFFSRLEGFFERIFVKRRRKTLWDKIQGEHILEVGVGIGKNFPYYPPDIRVTALDFSQDMLKKARKNRQSKNVAVELVLMDTQTLCYADNSFDTIIATFVFASAPFPVKGLHEMFRVCKPGGQVLLLEHVLSSNHKKAMMMKILNPLIRFTLGTNINRQTVKTVQACGFEKVVLDPTSSDIVKLIQAIK